MEEKKNEQRELGRDEVFAEVKEVKEVDFDAEWERYFEHRGEMATVNVKHLAKHFLAFGLSASNPITATDRGIAEEIIVNLKRVEQDYHINLTREMEWLRNQVKKEKGV